MSARRRPRDPSSIAGGVAVWLCGVGVVALALWLIFLVAGAGLPDFLRTVVSPPVAAAIWRSAAIIALALPVTIAIAFFAGIAGAEPNLGGRTAAWLDTMLPYGATIPAVTIGAATSLAWLDGFSGVRDLVRSHPVLSIAAALVVLNLPRTTLRFRSILRAAGERWMTAALAAGADALFALRTATLRRAMPGLVGATSACAAQMLGETALAAIVLALATGGALTIASPAPFAVHLWMQLQDGARIGDPSVASQALLLMAAILSLRLIGELLAGRRARLAA
ncbi:MAG TPA: hypothetical protein VEJ20_09840 [Candidatus Eremiobacteraceae bacterium]|nr:hypothetical protein [Candidatus Eremiobacteraceae bacterium]